MAEDKFIIKNGAVVENTSSGTTVLDIQGQDGQLFSVTDNLVGDIFAVSDITGMPILTVNSNGTVSIDGDFYVGTGKTSGYNTGDQDLSDLLTNGEGHSVFVDVSGDTMTGDLYVNKSTASNSTATGAIRTAGGLGVVGAANIGSTLTAGGDIKTTSTTASNSTTTGSGVFNGGVGIAGAVNVGSSLTTAGAIKTTNATSSTSTTTGSLIAAGGAGIAGALYVGGLGNFSGALTSANHTINGTDYNMFTMKRTTGAGSSILFSNSGGNLGKLGFDASGNLIMGTGASVDGSSNMLNITPGGTVTVYGRIGPNANNTYSSGDVSYRWSNVYTQLLNAAGAATFSSSITASGIIKTTDSTASSSTSTGALIVNGGAGINGAIYNNGTINSTGILQTSNTTTSSSTTTGSLIVSGGAGIGEDIYIAGQVAFGSTTGKCQMIYNSTENSIDFIIN